MAINRKSKVILNALLSDLMVTNMIVCVILHLVGWVKINTSTSSGGENSIVPARTVCLSRTAGGTE